MVLLVRLYVLFDDVCMDMCSRCSGKWWFLDVVLPLCSRVCFSRLDATDLIANFKRWLYTSDASYMFASDRTLEMPQPASPDVAKTDMLRCPRWLITHLVEARRTELKTETAWREMGAELNETKKKLTLATGLDEIKAKDAVIKKLNASLQVMYRAVEEKTKELEDVRGKAIHLATQLRAIKASGGSLSHPSSPAPEGSSGDASETIRALREEVVKLKAQVEFAPARPRNLTLRPSVLTSAMGASAIPPPLLQMPAKPPPPSLPPQTAAPMPQRPGAQPPHHHQTQQVHHHHQQQQHQLQQATSAIPNRVSPYLAGGSSPSFTSSSPLLSGLNPLSSASPASHNLMMPNSTMDDDIPPPPEEDDSTIIPFSKAKFWLTPENQRVALASLLTDPEMIFVDVLGKALAGGNDADSVAAYLINLYSSQDTLLPVLEHLIATEVSRCKSVNTLFRGEELSSRVLRSFVKGRGFDYIQKILGGLIAEVAANNYIFEVDPNRSNPTMDMKANFTKLEELTQRFLDQILDSYSWVPPEFLRLCKCIYSHSAVKFANEDFEQLVVSGFMFLRFICPAIAAPESYKLSPIENPEARRTLLLVGKILQNLANGVEFKEPYLQDMNAFLSRNAQRVHNFFQKLRTYPVEIDGNAPYLVDISRSVFTRREKIKMQSEKDSAADKLWMCEVVAPLASRLKTILQHISNANSAAAPGGGSVGAQIGAKTDLLDNLSSVLFDNNDLLSKVLIAIPHVSSDQATVKKSVAENVATLASFGDYIGVLSRALITNEPTTSAYDFLHSSFTKHAFTSFSLNTCGEWLGNVLNEILSPLISQNTFIETDASKVTDPSIKAKYNREDMLLSVKRLANTILLSFVNALPSGPRPLWLFANTLSLNTTQDVGQFLIINYLVPFIENPAGAAPNLFQVKPRKEASRSLQIIADVVRNYANSSNVFLDNVPMSQAAWTDSFLEKIGNWSRTHSPLLIDVVAAAAGDNSTPQQESIGNAVVALAGFFNENIGLFEQLLEGIQTTHNLVFGIQEYVDAMTPPPERPKELSAVSTATGGTGSRPNSGNFQDPKAAAKKAKEDDKRAKEEEERRKKEEKKKKEEEDKRKKEEDKKKKDKH